MTKLRDLKVGDTFRLTVEGRIVSNIAGDCTNVQFDDTKLSNYLDSNFEVEVLHSPPAIGDTLNTLSGLHQPYTIVGFYKEYWITQKGDHIPNIFRPEVFKDYIRTSKID